MKHMLVPFVAGLVAASAFGEALDREFSPAYFWIWNDRLDAAKLKEQLVDMRDHGLSSVCIHPWPSRFRPEFVKTSWMTPEYLSPEYLEVYRRACEDAKALGISCWLYDEGGWPSGGAAGLVMDSDPEKRFAPRELGNDDPKSNDLRLRVGGYGKRCGRESYPSMIEPGATERFLEITHEAYRRVLGDAFGKSIRLTFTDEPEPHEGRAGRWLAVSSDFEEEFRRRKGYAFSSVAADLRSLSTPWSDGLARHRIDYMDVLSDLFVERYVLPVRAWCRKNGLLSSGHFCGDEGPTVPRNIRCSGALLRNLRGEDAPGVDVIWRQLYPRCSSHPGDEGRQPEIPRYAASAARQNGSRYVLSESLGVYGNAIPPALLKWICDYQLVRGVNRFVFGYYYYATRGAWMHYLEPTLGPVQPWWDFMPPFHRYLGNVGAFLAAGRPSVEIAVYYDQRGFWAGGPDSVYAVTMHDLVTRGLDSRPCDYDFVDDELIAASKGLDRGELTVGKARYRTLFVPSSKWMTPEAKAALARFRAAGGCILGAEDVAKAHPLCELLGRDASDVRVTKRTCDNGETRYFLVNECYVGAREFAARFGEKGRIVRYDPETGRETPLERSADGTLACRLEACGSLAVKILPDGAPSGSGTVDRPFSTPLATLKDGWTIRRLVRHYAGKADFEVVPVDEAPRRIALGDWRDELGGDFSGKALYRTVYRSADEIDAELDLGTVCWAAGVKVNGEALSGRFAPPHRWRVRLHKGENVIEVTVANLLVNALDEREHKRIARDFPPDSVYSRRQVRHDRDYVESGLFGPVCLFVTSDR